MTQLWSIRTTTDTGRPAAYLTRAQSEAEALEAAARCSIRPTSNYHTVSDITEYGHHIPESFIGRLLYKPKEVTIAFLSEPPPREAIGWDEAVHLLMNISQHPSHLRRSEAEAGGVWRQGYVDFEFSPPNLQHKVDLVVWFMNKGGLPSSICSITHNGRTGEEFEDHWRAPERQLHLVSGRVSSPARNPLDAVPHVSGLFYHAFHKPHPQNRAEELH